MKIKNILLSAAILAMSSLSFAKDPVNTKLLKESLNSEANIESIQPSVIPGLFEVQINGQIVYLSADGEKIITGDIYDLKNKVSHTEKSKNGLRKAALASIKDSDKIIYKAKNEKYKVMVFTDITCPYCAKLHEEVEDFNKAGITVEYLAFPRAGVGSSAQKNMQKIWCAENKTAALTAAKLNKKLPKGSCKGSQTIDQFMVGQNIGVTATPTIVFTDGEVLPGYATAEELAEYLKEKNKG